MTSESHLIGVVLVAILVDRMLIRHRPDALSFPSGSTRLGLMIPAVLMVPAMTVIAAFTASIVARFVLKPVDAEFLCAPIFIAMMLAIALAGEMLLSRGHQFSALNRIFARATVVGSILGLAAIVPWPGQTPMESASIAGFVSKAAVGGAFYAFLRIIYDGILEKVTDRKEKPIAPLAREMTMLSLLALVCVGILKIFH